MSQRQESGKEQIPSPCRSTVAASVPGGASAPWYGIPWDIAGRIGLLFTALCLIKLVMLLGFRKHLFHIHWRFAFPPENWLNLTAFYTFVLLVGLNLWCFGKKCATGGVGVVRAANACVLALGVFFISLTFHAGDKNYLYPWLNGTLSWWELNSYLSQALFFQTPYLAAWLLVYAVIYYGLARSGREQLVIFVTSIFAVLYLAIFLESLAAYRSALVVADCLGLVCLLAGMVGQRPLYWLCQIQPWIWLAWFLMLFHQNGSNIGDFEPDCVILCGWGFVLFAGCSVLSWHRKFYSAWTWVLPFAFASFLLFTCINYPLAPNYQNLFCLGLTLPRYFLGEFFLALALLAAAKLYRHWLPGSSLLWLDVINLALITVSAFDLRLTQIMRIRLDWQALAFGADMKMVWLEAQPYLPGLVLGLIFVTSLYAILNGLWLRGPASKSLSWGPSGWFLLATFLLLGLAGNWIAQNDRAEGQTAFLLAESNPLFRRAVEPVMERKTFMDTSRQLGLEPMLQRPASSPSRPPRRMNVLIIFQESSYNKYLSLFNGKENTQPLLAVYTNRMEVFPNFFSNYAASINARFAAFTGLYPVSDYKTFTFNRVKVKSIFDILHGAGYHCSLFYSSFLDYTGFREFLDGRGVDALFDADNMPGSQNEPSVIWGVREEETASAIRSQIREYATNHQNFFLTYVPVAPHNPFDGVPSQFRKHHLKQMDDYTPDYLNDLLYMDWCITSIVDELKSTGLLDSTLVVITDDHGEMLGENGGPIGHGWVATPLLTNIPLIIMDPDNPGYHINDTIGSQIDLLPTIVDLLGLSLPGDQIYQGTSLYSSTAQTDRTIYLNSIRQYGIIRGSHYLCGTRETRNSFSEEGPSLKFYDITNTAARTMFPVIDSWNTPSPVIDQFDQFQDNFLKNYSQYCDMIRN